MGRGKGGGRDGRLWGCIWVWVGCGREERKRRMANLVSYVGTMTIPHTVHCHMCMYTYVLRP